MCINLLSPFYILLYNDDKQFAEHVPIGGSES